MENLNARARVAGLLYLIVVVTGIFSIMYVPQQLIDWNNSSITFQNISSRQLWFRYGIFGHIICYSSFLLLPLALYQLLHKVHKEAAFLMVILAVVSVPISFMNISNKFTILNIMNDVHYQATFSAEQLQTQVMFYLNQYESGILLISLFWGLWLLPFGYLVYKSNFLPKFFGVLLMLGCFGYIMNFIGNIIISDYSDLGISKYLSMPASIGEIGICLWLLIFGAKKMV